MAYQGISTGSVPNDGTGDSLLAGATKINSNFTEIYNALGDGSTISFIEKVQNSLYKITTTSTNKTLEKFEHCTVSVDNLTLTLPASPSSGDSVIIGIGGNYFRTLVSRNGSNIMGISENITIDIPHLTLNFIYINNNLGWRISA